MPDMVPAARIAAVAHRRVSEAAAKLRAVHPQGYSRDDHEKAKDAIAAALELLALIVPAPAMVNVTDDLVIEPFIPPAEPADAGISY